MDLRAAKQERALQQAQAVMQAAILTTVAKMEVTHGPAVCTLIFQD